MDNLPLWKHLQNAWDDYMSDYAMSDGGNGSYQPTETENALLDDAFAGFELTAALRAYAAREEVVERCARAREAHYEKHGFGETPIDGFEIAAMQAALAAFLGEET